MFRRANYGPIVPQAQYPCSRFVKANSNSLHPKARLTLGPCCCHCVWTSLNSAAAGRTGNSSSSFQASRLPPTPESALAWSLLEASVTFPSFGFAPDLMMHLRSIVQTLVLGACWAHLPGAGRPGQAALSVVTQGLCFEILHYSRHFSRTLFPN